MAKKIITLIILLTFVLSACSAQSPEADIPAECQFEYKKFTLPESVRPHYPIQFGEGLIAAEYMFSFIKNKGFLDMDGNITIPLIYDSVGNFSEGLAMVGIDEKYGYIDNNGDVVIPLQYDGAGSFSNGWAVIYNYNRDPVKWGVIDNDMKYGAINPKGELVIPAVYEFLTTSGKFAIARKEGKYGLLDQGGNILTPFIYEWIIKTSYSDNQKIFGVKKDGKWGYINEKGEVVIPFEYHDADAFYEGLASVCKTEGTNHKVGFIDKENNIVIPFEYNGDENHMASFHNGLAVMVKGGKTGVIDRENRTIIPFGKYDYIGPLNNKFIIVSKTDQKGNEKYGAINRSGKIIVPVQYEYLTGFHEGLAVFHENGKQGYIDTEGRVVIPAIYDHAPFFSEDITWGFTEGEGWTLIKKVN